jgi:inhibitor of KinA sporulation pathway (predicted exonuclease)
MDTTSNKTIQDLEREAAQRRRAAKTAVSGQSNVAVQYGDTRSVPRDVVVNDMCDLIRRIPLEDEQIRALYDAILTRLISKVCYRCAQLKPVLYGDKIWPDGDMSKPKRFVCKECLK